MTPAWTTLPLRRTAKIGGAADQVTYATSVFAEFFVRPTLIVSGDAARTASNIVAHSCCSTVGLNRSPKAFN